MQALTKGMQKKEEESYISPSNWKEQASLAELYVGASVSDCTGWGFREELSTLSH